MGWWWTVMVLFFVVSNVVIYIIGLKTCWLIGLTIATEEYNESLRYMEREYGEVIGSSTSTTSTSTSTTSTTPP